MRGLLVPAPSGEQPLPIKLSQASTNTRPLHGEDRQAAPPPELQTAVAQLDPRRDDDLVARGAHHLKDLRGDDRAAGVAPALRLLAVGVDGNDLAVRFGDEALDNVAVVLESAADEVGQESLRVAARVQGRLRRAVLRRRVSGNGGSNPLQAAGRRARFRPNLLSRRRGAIGGSIYVAVALTAIRIRRGGARSRPMFISRLAPARSKTIGSSEGRLIKVALGTIELGMAIGVCGVRIADVLRPRRSPVSPVARDWRTPRCARLSCARRGLGGCRFERRSHQAAHCPQGWRPVRRVPHHRAVSAGRACVLRVRIREERPRESAPGRAGDVPAAGRRVTGAGPDRPLGGAGSWSDSQGEMG